MSSEECEIFVRPLVTLEPEKANRLRWLTEMGPDQHEVPRSFQKAWEDIIHERRGNIGALDGYAFVADTVMWEEGFQKIKVDDSERETESVRRSFFTHLKGGKSHSCVLVFTKLILGGKQGILIQSMVTEQFQRPSFPDSQPPSMKFATSARHWMSNVYGGSLRSNVADMYRDLPELAMRMKDELVFKLKAIIAHGLEPPVLVGLEGLPLEIIEKMVGLCQPVDGIRLARSCRRTLATLDSDRLWRIFTLRKFPALKSTPENELLARHEGSWKQCFKEECLREARERFNKSLFTRPAIGYYLPLGWHPQPPPPARNFLPENPDPLGYNQFFDGDDEL